MKLHNLFKNKKLLYLTIATAILVVAAATAVLVWAIGDKTPNDYTTVLTVAGEEVAYGEFMLAMDSERAEVTAYFQNTYRVADEVYLWDSELKLGDENPLAVLKQAAIENIKLYKYEQHLMKQYGTVEDISFKKFVELWQADTKERAEKAEQGTPVYGPTAYTKAEYYKHLHNLRKEDLREAMYKQSGLDDVEYRFSDLLIEQKIEQEFDSVKIEINHDIYDKITY